MSNNKDSLEATNVEGMKEDCLLANVDLEDEEDESYQKEQFTLLILQYRYHSQDPAWVVHTHSSID